MKTILFFLFLLLQFCFSKIEAQPWQTLESGTQLHLFDVHFTNHTDGYATVNNGTYLKTTNAGHSWVVRSTSYSIAMTDLVFLENNSVFASGLYGSIFKSSDGGNTWTSQSPTGFMLRGIDFLNVQKGFVVGDLSAIYNTTNGGASWNSVTSPISDMNFTDVEFISEDKGFITGIGSSNLLFTNNGGLSWNDGKIRGGIVMGTCVEFVETIGYVGGYEEAGQNYNPLIFRSTNSGQTWMEYSLISYGQIYSIAVSPVDPNKVCAVGQYVNDPIHGNKGLIMRSVDGGVNWIEEAWGTSQKFRSVSATSTAFYVVGNNGVILKSDHTVGISQSNSEIPQDYSLSQNYPNPFNPETKINFLIPKSGLVTLVIYDVTGREVKTLVHNVLSAGSYEYSFTAKNLTSGAYFYKLQAENFAQTKKMMLIK